MYMGSFLLWRPAVTPDNSDYRQSGGTGNAEVIVLLYFLKRRDWDRRNLLYERIFVQGMV